MLPAPSRRLSTSESTRETKNDATDCDCSRDRLTKVDEITIKNHCTDIVIFVKLLVNGGDGRNTGSSVVELACCGARCFRLQIQKARHNLQAVFHAVLDLLHQQVFLPTAFLKGTFCLLEFFSLVEIA